MQFAKRLLMVAGAVTLTGLLGVAIIPKAAHAIVATLVQVVNTSANPVPTYDSGTRFEASICYGFGPVSAASNACVPDANTNTFKVPMVTSAGAPVKRLVVDNVSGVCSSFNNPSLFIKTVILSGQFVPDSVANSETAFTHYIPIVGAPYTYVNDPSSPFPLASVPETDYSYGQTVHFAFNPGDTVSMYLEYFFTSVGNRDAFCVGRVEGTLATQ
jgi:hypothetical protein